PTSRSTARSSPTSPCTTSRRSAHWPRRPRRRWRPDPDRHRARGAGSGVRGGSSAPLHWYWRTAAMDDLTERVGQALAAIAGTTTRVALEADRVALLGMPGTVTAALKQLGSLPAAERKQAGERINAFKQQLLDAISARSQVLEEQAVAARMASEGIDVSL